MGAKMVLLIKEFFLGVFMAAMIVGAVFAIVGIGSGVIYIPRLFGDVLTVQTQRTYPFITDAGRDQTSGHGYYNRKAERGR